MVKIQRSFGEYFQAKCQETGIYFVSDGERRANISVIEAGELSCYTELSFKDAVIDILNERED